MNEDDATTEGSQADPEEQSGAGEAESPETGEGGAAPDDASETGAESAGSSAESGAESGAGGRRGGDERLFWYVLGVATGVVVVSALWFGYFIWLERDMSRQAGSESATPPSFVRSSSYRRASRRAGRLESSAVTGQLAGLDTSAGELSGLGATARESGVLLLDIGDTDGPTLRSRLTGVYGGELSPLAGAELSQLLDLAEGDASGLRWSELALVERQRTTEYLTGVAERAAGAARRFGLSLAVVRPPVQGDLEDTAAKAYLALLIREMYRRGTLPVVEMLPGARLPERVPALLITPEVTGDRSQVELVRALRDRGYEGLVLARPGADAPAETTTELITAGADCVLGPSGARRTLLDGLKGAPFTTRVSTASRLLAVKSELGLLGEGDSLFPPLTRFEPVEPIPLERLRELRGVGGEGAAQRTAAAGSGEQAGTEGSTGAGQTGGEQPAGPERPGAEGSGEGQTGEQPGTGAERSGVASIAGSRWNDTGRELRSRSWLLVSGTDVSALRSELSGRGANITGTRRLKDIANLPSIVEGASADAVLVVAPFPSPELLPRVAGMEMPPNRVRFLTVWSETDETTPPPGKYGFVEVRLREGVDELPAERIAQYLMGETEWLNGTGARGRTGNSETND